MRVDMIQRFGFMRMVPGLIQVNQIGMTIQHVGDFYLLGMADGAEA